MSSLYQVKNGSWKIGYVKDGKLSEFVMTSIFGNSQAIRNTHYIQLRGDEMARVLSLE